MTFKKIVFCFLFAITITLPAISHAQNEKFDKPKTPDLKEREAAIFKKTEGGGSKQDSTPEHLPTTPQVKPDFSIVRVHLMEGSVVSGQLSVKSITVNTDFGKLVIPIDRILSLTPGLQSHPKDQKKIGRLIQQLGSNNAKERAKAQRALTGFGISIMPFLKKYIKDSDAERRTRIHKILLELQEIADDNEENGVSKKTPQLVREDIIVTDQFTIVGEVTPKSFQVKTKFGPLMVALSDIRNVEREIQSRKEEIRKKISVPGTSIIQVAAKSTGIRLRRGDRISFSATGKIVMTPWGSSSFSTPDGGQNFQWYVQNKIPGGCLVGRIGSNGTVFKIGSKASLTAKSSGILYLAIGMTNSYARGYSYPGQYDVKVRVIPQQ
ncbi:hypothetical protein MNBD_PLANCTO02-2217 [hydrothermal vent metagenome]|uniref:Uncharacterized protein n=1 Tax=hydrothermal vent metagenome TaxID=652676 RepID=A0A3B1DPC9_9ZZZZ